MGSSPGMNDKTLRMSRGDRERAEELAQRVSVRVWEASSRRQDEIRSPEAFEHGVLLNIHREFQREERRHRHGELNETETIDQRSTGVIEGVQKRELFSLVRSAVAKLTHTSQMVVRMKYFEGLQQRQIADRLSVHEVKVCRILQRARDRLKEMLG